MVDVSLMYKEYYNYIRAIAGRIIRGDANDIASAAFYKLSQCSYATNEAIAKEFLKTTAIRLSLDYLKAEKRRMANLERMKVDLCLHEEPTNEQEEKDAEMANLHAEVIKFIHDRIKELPERTRQVFELYYFEQKKPDQISELLNIKRHTVWSHLNNARTILRMEILFRQRR